MICQPNTRLLQGRQHKCATNIWTFCVMETVWKQLKLFH